MNDSKKEHWQVKTSNYVYTDPWIRVRVDKVIRPGGVKGHYSVVELKGGIGVVPVDENGDIYLVGQYRYAPDVYSWEIPKGAFENFKPAKSPLQTAKRELLEETGLTAKKWIKLTTVHTLLGSTNDKVYLFWATNLRADKPRPGKTENIKVLKVNLREFHKMVDRKEITDATTITAVLLWEIKHRQVLKILNS